MTVNISAIKTAFKTIFDAANTTTASPFDLSAGLANRVQKVLKVNPLKIPVQSSNFPYVTIYAQTKSIVADQIAKDQITARRLSDIGFNIIGAVWEQNSITDTSDPADEQVEKLMENVEELLRRNFKLSDTVKWTKPLRTSYHSLKLDEETHLRVGLLEITAKVEY